MSEPPRFTDPAVGAALDALSPPQAPDLTLAYVRQRARQRARPVGIVSQPRRTWMTAFLDRLAVLRQPAPALAALAVVLLGLSFLTSPMQGLASQFLTIFRVQDFAPVTIASTQGVPDLTRFGDMTPSASPSWRTQPVENLGAASGAVGFTVKAPAALPGDLVPQPSHIAVSAPQTVAFTFRAEKARAYLDSIGRSDFALPARFDGATLQVHVPAAAILTFAPPEPASSDGGRRDELHPTGGVLLVQGKSPTVEASGVSFEELRDFMLSLPGLAPETVAQIRAIGDLGSTLPVPVPAGQSARKVQVDGAPGLLYAEPHSRIAGGIIWQRDGIIYAAAGPLNEAELLALASSVR